MKTMKKVCFPLVCFYVGASGERHRFSALHRVHRSRLPVRTFRVCKRGEGRSTWAPAPPPMPPKPFTWMWRGEFKRSVQLSRCLFSVFFHRKFFAPFLFGLKRNAIFYFYFFALARFTERNSLLSMLEEMSLYCYS